MKGWREYDLWSREVERVKKASVTQVSNINLPWNVDYVIASHGCFIMDTKSSIDLPH